ncbi:heme peroxidase [Rhizoclosmatium globosum]|uniref:Heme peroxidase n=1 Tax=Rhizoclosmatium globosum TaxID=329046 RepID=A0A1Y2AZJ8_9FUNG|nr:heme peroxidase [Rhizoclosmatium globosum]|eukprot:ORY27982.1 heme peroxidase [Rhizoclosmatium globosum]
MATTQDMQRIPIFVGQTPEETAWPWIDNNEQSTWLDLSNLYGTTPEILSYIRNQSHPCKLRLDKNGNLLRENGKLVTGDQRAGQSPYLIGWHMLFTKEHNWQCDILAQKFPSMDADVLFYRAREATILVFQKFLVNEYVPGYSGEGRFRYLLSDRSMDYFIAEKNIKSSNLFNILYRLHTMIPDTIKIIDARGILVDTYSIDQVYYNTTLMTKYGLDALLRGSMWTPAYRYGRGYPTAMTTSRFNLCEIDFIRARERELGSYINTRKMYASNPTMSFYDPSVDWTRQLTEWSNFTSVPAIQNALEELYGNVENVELLAGAYLDNESEAASFGGIAYAVLLEEANTVIRGDRWSILNFDTAPRDFDWQNQLISTSYSRNIYDFVKQHTGMPCLPLDVMRVGEGQLVC